MRNCCAWIALIFGTSALACASSPHKASSPHLDGSIPQPTFDGEVTDSAALDSASSGPPSGPCGNGQIDPGEVCDGALTNNATCALLGYGGGNLACSSSCQFDVSACTGGPIRPRVVASRTSCTAPCGVFFDATTTQGLSGSNYWRANWSWDFGDPTSTHKGTIGFVVGHVFDNPGTYNVVTRVHDLAGNAGNTTTTIVVSPMSGTTYYVASNGNDSNNGTSMSTAWKTAAHALPAGYGTNNSILFRRGDTFTLDSSIHAYQFATPGPFLMGAYTDPGSPSTADPILSTAITNDIQFNLFSTDLRFQHLHLVATNGVTGWFEDTKNGNLIEYVEMEKAGTMANPATNIHLDGSAVINTFVFDNNLHDFIGYGVYSGTNNVALVGNQIVNFTGGTSSPLHGVRLDACTNGKGNCNINNYMAENTITVGPTGQIFTAFTIHGDIQNFVVVGNTVDHPCGVGPTNLTVVENPNTGLFEGNVMDDPASNIGYINLTVDAGKVEVRNNLFVNGDNGVILGSRSYTLLPANFIDQDFIENNTYYQNPPTGQPLNYAVYFGVHQHTTGTATFLNNIFWEGMQNFSSSVISADGMGTEVSDYNDMYAPAATTVTNSNVGAHGVQGDPGFASPPTFSSSPITVSGFKLQGTSPAIDTGTNDHVYQDFYGVTRPQGSAWNMGAFE
jgi:hypothetical protein